jgi:hypothetical protein
MKTTLLSPGAECAAGGQKIEAGVDDGRGGGVAGDGKLQDGEITSTATVCNSTGGGGTHLIDANGVDMGRLVSSSDMGNETTLLTSAGYLYDLEEWNLSVQKNTIYFTGAGCTGTMYSTLSSSSEIFRQSDKFLTVSAGTFYRSLPGTFASVAFASYGYDGQCWATSGNTQGTQLVAATPEEVGLAAVSFAAPIHAE